MEAIDDIVEPYKHEKISIVDVETVVRLLELAGSYNKSDFNNEKYISCSKALYLRRSSAKYRLIIRLDRDIAKGTGTLLSPNDRLLGDSFNDDVILTLYRIKGSVEKGWSGKPLWIPNIKFPGNSCFYDTISILDEE